MRELVEQFVDVRSSDSAGDDKHVMALLHPYILNGIARGCQLQVFDSHSGISQLSFRGKRTLFFVMRGELEKVAGVSVRCAEMPSG